MKKLAISLLVCLVCSVCVGEDEDHIDWFPIGEPETYEYEYTCFIHGQHGATLEIWLDVEIETSEITYCLICWRDYLDIAIGRMEKVEK